jgi:hypothetical protein
MVRTATYKDLAAITEFLMARKDDLGWGHIEVDEWLGRKTLNRLMATKMGTVLVSYKDDELQACMAATVDQYWFSKRDCYVTDVFFISENPFSSKRMLEMLEEWARGLRSRVVDISIGISSGINVERTEQFYESMGYRKMGATYMKVIADVESTEGDRQGLRESS